MSDDAAFRRCRQSVCHVLTCMSVRLIEHNSLVNYQNQSIMVTIFHGFHLVETCCHKDKARRVIASRHFGPCQTGMCGDYRSGFLMFILCGINYIFREWL